MLCFRDKETTVDVFLQGAPAGAAQEADQILDEFPTTAEQLFEYDCLIAFDPDWQQLSDEQIELVDRWLSSKAGGLITVAGPVYTPEWTTLARDRRGISLVKGFYPVSFYRRSSMRLARGRDPSAQPWPIELSDAGQQARQLRLDDNPIRSATMWESFSGVFAYFPVRAAKPGAVVFGRFGNPQTAIDNQLPIFLAGQFYGAGRVFYIGSGEFWRLRAVAPDLFDTLYMKLIRYVSEGRLLRDSSRGVLIVSKDRSILGETIVVRASLTDAQFRPLVQEQVQASLITPNGTRQPLPLRAVTNTADANTPAGEGSFAGQFTAVQEGDYRIELPVPDSDTLEMLSTRRPCACSGSRDRITPAQRCAAGGNGHSHRWRLLSIPAGGGRSGRQRTGCRLGTPGSRNIHSRHPRQRFPAAADELVDGLHLRSAVPGMDGKEIEQTGLMGGGCRFQIANFNFRVARFHLHH